MVVCGTCVDSRSIMFESCLMPNIEALYTIHLYLPVIAEENSQQPRPIYVYVSFYKNIYKKRRDQCIMQILLLDFSPQ